MAIAARRTLTTWGGQSERKRRPLRGLALVGAVALSLLAAGCGGGSSSARVAQIGTNGGANSSSSSISGSNNPQAFSACMRNHGVPNFPDPDSSGRIQIPSTIDDRLPTVRAAYRACRSLAPSEDSISGQGDVMSQEQLLAFAKCMRAHRVPAFPDPQVVNDHIRMRVTPGQIDPNSPLVTAAMTACRSKLGANAGRGAQKLVQGASARPAGGRK
jgi:hypothetical protein